MTTRTSRAGRPLLLGAAVVAGVAVLGLVVVLATRPGSGGDPAAATPSPDRTTTEPSTEPTSSGTPTTSPTASPSTPASPSASPTPDQTAAPDTRASTVVTVVTAGWSAERAAVEVSGLADVVESGGTCTLVVSRDSASASAAAGAEPDATSTSCGTLTIPRASVAPGRWTAVLRYDSATTTGTSAPVTIEVPA